MIVDRNFEEEICRLAYMHRVNFNLRVHNWNHTKRVVEYAKMVSLASFPEQFKDVLVVAYFHDIGRHTDGKEFVHGKVSATITKNVLSTKYPEIDLESILFAIFFHPSDQAPDGGPPVLSGYSLPNHINPKIAMCLWDADRLDIVRIKRHRPVKLDFLNTDWAQRFANSEEHMMIYTPEHMTIYD